MRTIVTSAPRKPISALLPAGWPWLLPRLAFVLFVGGVAMLLWISDRTEKEEQRAILISDVLWLEQNLRFALTRTEEVLAQVPPQHTQSAAAFEPHAKALLAGNAGLRQVVWIDNEHRIRQAFPGKIEATVVGEAIDAVPSRETARLARALGKPVYSPAYPVVDNDWRFEVHVPIHQGDRIVAVAVGAYSIRRLLDEAIPWWLAERYRIGIIDSTGMLLGVRSKVEATADASYYDIPFEPPGQGLTLHAVPYRTPAPLAGRLLSAALVLLAVIVLWSLWILRRHVQRRLAAEDALRHEHAFRKAMEDSLQTGMRALGLDGRITYVNPAFCRMVGYSAEELIGSKAPQPFWPSEERENIRTALAAARSPNPPSGGIEIRLQRRDGERFDALLYEAPLIDANGNHAGWMGSILDITERKRARELARQQEEKLAATARLVSMGEMASSLAHELNQPLAAIASYNAGCLNMLDAGTGDPQDIRTALAKSAEQAQRAGRIIRRIYEFVRRSEPKNEPCAPSIIIDEAIGLVEADARRQGVRIQYQSEGNLPEILGDRVLLAQVLLNLIRNGIESMQSKPREERLLDIRVAEADGHVAIRIADRGTGIPTEVEVRLFEPFFTTKVEGMGMGLNICRSIVEAHHGRIWHEANPGGGSIFSIRIPKS